MYFNNDKLFVFQNVMGFTITAVLLVAHHVRVGMLSFRKIATQKLENVSARRDGQAFFAKTVSRLSCLICTFSVCVFIGLCG